MRLSSWLLGLVVLPSTAHAWTPASSSATDALAAESLDNLLKLVSNGTLKSYLATQNVSQTCTEENVVRRKDYTTLSQEEKLDFVRAMQCLMDAPALTPPELIPGARSRNDDFVGTHVNQTEYIHLTGNFLYWHRMFIWTFEQTLRNECGYQGYLPYWNYAKTSEDLLNSPIFDGSNTSISGNGNFVAHNATQGLPSGLLDIRPGTGGGCIETGPFAGMIANISATAPVDTYENITVGTFLSYQPRCVKRDITNALGQQWANDSSIADLLANPLYQTGIGDWQTQLQSTGTDTVGFYGLHAYGHMTINGDPSTDFYNSPNEPSFWLHHAQVDREFSIWQNQAFTQRGFQISGTRTLGNVPPSANATIDDHVGVGYISGVYEEGIAIKNYASTMGGPLCYVEPRLRRDAAGSALLGGVPPDDHHRASQQPRASTPPAPTDRRATRPLLVANLAPFRPFQRFFGQPAHPHHTQSLLRYLFPHNVRQRYRERLLDFRLETLPYYKLRLQSRIYRYIVSRQHRRLDKTRWVDRIATAARSSRRLLLGPPSHSPSGAARYQKTPLRHRNTHKQRRGDHVSKKPLEDAGEQISSRSSKMSQWGGNGYGLGPGSSDPYGSREPGARRKKLAAMAKSVYNAGVATASEIRNQYDNTRIRGVIDVDDSSYKVSIPGSFPDVAIVTKGEAEMVLFPSYAKSHIREFRDDGSRISRYEEGDHREGALSDEEYWRNEWARAEDRKAVVDVDVRGWVYSPHRGPMTRRNRVLIGLARRLSGIPAPTHKPEGQLQGLHAGHEEREEMREEQRIAKEAAEIERRGRAEGEAAVRGGYSEQPQEDDSEGEGRPSPYKNRSGTQTPASTPPSPTLTARSVTNSASTELSEAELAVANANLMARLGPFLTTPMIQHPVTLFFYNDSQSQSRTVETNDAGHFSMRAALDFVPTHVRVIANDLSTVQEIEIIDDEGVSVISDIDDTIKNSSISLGAREIFRNTFIRDLKDLSIEGVREWYGELYKMGVRFHYCSNSPWQLFPVIATFFRHAGLPPGSLHLKQYSGMLQGIFEPVAERKKGNLEKILRDFPLRKFILIGDSGEADLEVYTDLAVANPGRILAVFIRDVTTPEQTGYFDSTSFNEAPPGPARREKLRNDQAASRPNLPLRAVTEPPKPDGPATGTLIDLSDEPAPMDVADETKLEKMKGVSSGSAELASLAARGKKPPPPRPNKPAALKGESSGPPSKTGQDSEPSGPPLPTRKPLVSQVKSASPHPLAQIQNSSQQSLRSSPGSVARKDSGATNGSPSPSIRSSSQTASPGSNSTTSTKQPPPPPPPRRRVTPQQKPSPNMDSRSQTLRHTNSNPDIERLDLRATSSIPEILPPPGRTNTATTFDNMLGPSSASSNYPQAQYVQINKKLELWRRRLERAHETLDREDVRLYTWRRGQDVVLEAVGLVKETLDNGPDKRQ